MRNILVAIDFSAVSDELIRRGIEIAKAFDGRIRLIHVARPDPYFVGYEPGPQSVRNSRAQTLRDDREELQEMADRVEAQGVEAEALVVQGPAWETLLEKAEEWKVDAMIIGNRGHGLIRKAVLGSVSEGVLKNTRYPVLLIPAEQEEEEEEA